MRAAPANTTHSLATSTVRTIHKHNTQYTTLYVAPIQSSNESEKREEKQRMSS